MSAKDGPARSQRWELLAEALRAAGSWRGLRTARVALRPADAVAVIAAR